MQVSPEILTHAALAENRAAEGEILKKALTLFASPGLKIWASGLRGDGYGERRVERTMLRTRHDGTGQPGRSLDRSHLRNIRRRPKRLAGRRSTSFRWRLLAGRPRFLYITTLSFSGGAREAASHRTISTALGWPIPCGIESVSRPSELPWLRRVTF